MSIREITREIADLADIIYFSARKLGSARGGAICTNNKDVYMKMREYITLYEGFLTYGGMSVREMEAIAVGLDETMDENMINQGPQFIAYMTEELLKKGVPVVTQPGGLGCHINAMEFVDHIPQTEYPAGALAAALYLQVVYVGWKEVRCLSNVMKMETKHYPIWSLFVLQCRAVYTRYHK